jgi:hypothetical protein
LAGSTDRAWADSCQSFGDPYDDEPPVASEPPDECDLEPDEYYSTPGFSHAGHEDDLSGATGCGFGRGFDDGVGGELDDFLSGGGLGHDFASGLRRAAAGHDPEVADEASIGAEAMVVIHATGAEVDALINGRIATGGEADHHGPIPQSSLRKHLIKALTQGLLPNLPTTPNSPHPGATTRRPRTGTHSNTGGARANSNIDADAHADTSTDTGAGIAGSRGAGAGAGIEVRITDRPPPSDPDRYTPSPAMDRYVRWRDRTCQFPGCNRPAEFTDLDHRIPFAAGGRTTAANLWCLCRHHHRLKHEGGWEIAANADGSYTWTSPTGRRYRNNPTIYHPPASPTWQPTSSESADRDRPPNTA